MFFTKSARKIDKQISKGDAYKEARNGDAILSVKAETRDELFSRYNYNNDDVINRDFTDYIWHKAKLVPLNQNIKIQIHCPADTSKREVKTSLKNYYRAEYLETKNELKKISFFSITCLLLGIITLLVLSVFNFAWNNFYVVSIVDILVWVFVWEAFDSFFFKRWDGKRKLKRIQKLYSAEIELVNIERGNDE